MISDIKIIRDDLDSELLDLMWGTDSENAIDSYLQAFGNKKLTKKQTRKAIEYFLRSAKDKVYTKLSNYLYDESQAIQEILAEIKE